MRELIGLFPLFKNRKIVYNEIDFVFKLHPIGI